MRAAALLLLSALPLAAADAVSWRIQPMTFPVEVADTGPRGAKAPGGGYYPVKSTRRIEQRTVDIIIIDNGLLTAWVCPAWGARLLRATLRDGTELFYWNGDPVQGILPWTPGGVRASVPFFEHGLHLEQPAGWRIVRASDGALTVACDLRFTQYDQPRDKERYGRYGDESVAVLITVKPGSTLIAWHQRQDNPNPLPRGDRAWNNALYPVPVALKKTMVEDRKTKQMVERDAPDLAEMDRRIEFIFPARWVVDHGPTTVHTSPHWSNLRNWDVSHFALDAPYGFVGAWYAQEGVNRLRINDPVVGRGAAAKLWNAPQASFFECWGGEGIVFETPGALRPAWKPMAFTHRFWLARGIGRADYATDDLAVGIDGSRFAITGPAVLDIAVADGGGPRASGRIGPDAVLKGDFDGRRLRIVSGERVLLDRSFPLDRPEPRRETPVPADIQAAFAKLIAPDPEYLEKQCVGRNQGQPGLTDGLAAARALRANANPVETLSLARVAQRFGDLDTAERLARLAPGPAADLVLGLVALERGQETDFGSAGWEADVMRALGRIRAGDRPGAVALVDRYLAQVPDAWYPRLFRALWTRDAAAAAALAAENPASPEAQAALRELGLPHELDRLLAGNAHADVHCGIFLDQALRGVWKPLPRYTHP